LVNGSFQNVLYIFDAESVKFKDWLAILETNIMSDSVIVLANVLKIAFYSTNLTYYFQSITPSGSVHWSTLQYIDL
jgi:hypothetical protein